MDPMGYYLTIIEPYLCSMIPPSFHHIFHPRNASAPFSALIQLGFPTAQVTEERAQAVQHGQQVTPGEFNGNFRRLSDGSIPKKIPIETVCIHIYIYK